MNRSVQFDEISRRVAVIIDDRSYYPQIMNAINDIHDILVGIGAVDARSFGTQGTQLHAGYSYSPTEAALCIFDLARTTMFARGIRQAVSDKLQEGKKPVKILYPGCGPYAWLALLTACSFRAEDIRFSVMDIHEESTASVNKMISALDIADYFDSVTTENVLFVDPSVASDADLVVIEIMSNALRKEPQIAVAQHFASSMKRDAVLIPEEIRVIPAFADTKSRSHFLLAERIEPEDVFFLDAIATLNKLTASKGNFEATSKVTRISALPELLKKGYQPELQTEVDVYKSFKLRRFDSPLTSPLPIKNAPDFFTSWQITFTDSPPEFLSQFA